MAGPYRPPAARWVGSPGGAAIRETERTPSGFAARGRHPFLLFHFGPILSYSLHQNTPKMLLSHQLRLGVLHVFPGPAVHSWSRASRKMPKELSLSD